MYYNKFITALFLVTFQIIAWATPNVHANYVYIKDISSNKVIMTKNAEIQRPIASLTKLMMAMIVIDANQPANELLDITEEDVDHYKNSSSRLPIGTLMSRKMLLHLALMSSENRAAHSLARHYPGGTKTFINQMNYKAKQLGLNNTKFTDPTGLNEENMSTAKELAILVEAASKYKLITEFSTDKEQDVQYKKYINTNQLARGMDSWPLILSKTGYTQEAGRCVVMKTDINNKSIVFVILDAPTSARRTLDAKAIKKWIIKKVSS